MVPKYHSRKARTSDGIVHDSRREARRWVELNLLSDAGEITDLQRQVTFELLPNQYAPSTEVYAKGTQKGKIKPGKLMERKVEYIADFVYVNASTGEKIVEDTKGVRTKDYVIKRKLMLLVHGIRIREV